MSGRLRVLGRTPPYVEWIILLEGMTAAWIVLVLLVLRMLR